mgnify:CR=1 FL=1
MSRNAAIDGGATARYQYNALSQRVTKTMDGQTTVYHYDLAGRLLAETDAQGNTLAVGRDLPALQQAHAGQGGEVVSTGTLDDAEAAARAEEAGFGETPLFLEAGWPDEGHCATVAALGGTAVRRQVRPCSPSRRDRCATGCGSPSRGR